MASQKQTEKRSVNMSSYRTGSALPDILYK